MNLCIDCKHAKLGPDIDPGTMTCGRAMRERTDLVTGKVVVDGSTYCWIERSLGPCGRDGKLFEQGARISFPKKGESIALRLFHWITK